jgi:hypothetical protein
MELIGWGGECNVYLTEKGAFKEYNTKADAKSAREMQIELSYYDLAPEVYSAVKKIRKLDGRWSGWGYYCEEAECFSEVYREAYLDGEIENMAFEYEKDSIDYRLMGYLGLEYSDFHIGNYGYIERDGDKLLVIVDTGVNSFIDTDKETMV